MLHVSRKSFSAIKGEMSKELFMESALIPSTEQGKMYGLMDTLFMAFYACGLYVSGVIGDRFDLRKLLAGGMFITAAIMCVFGVSAFLDIRSLGLYAFLWALNGLVQSIGWPVNVAVMYVQLFLRRVLPYALAYACLKSLNYALFFWLPFYLTISLGMDDAKADMYSMLYDAGQIAGGFLGGYVTDKAGIRSPIVFAMIGAATSFILLHIRSLLHLFDGASHAQTTALLLATGFLLGGPANLISTAISADLGSHDSLREDTAALATVTG
ncbi:hypothetical protein DYB36_009002, partial [Aphanomyces astaci]